MRAAFDPGALRREGAGDRSRRAGGRLPASFEDIGDTAMAKLLSKSIKKSADAIEKDLINLEKKII